LARNKGDKCYTKSEKQLLISLINDYSLFGATDIEIIQILSVKIGEKISETLFYRLKKESRARREESEQWLDYYVRYQFVKFYRNKMEDFEYVQRNLLKVLTEEKEKQDKTIINQLSKTMAEISKVLAEFGMAPSIVSNIFDIVSMNYTAENSKVDEEVRQLRISRQKATSAINLTMDDEDDHENESLENEDAQRVF